MKTSKTTKPGCVLYSRVSSDRQLENTSLDDQGERLRAHAVAEGMVVLGEYSDPARSGRRADNRPGLQAALALAIEKHGAAFVVPSFDRLARNVRDLLEIAERLKAEKIALVSLREKVDTASDMGEFVMTLLGAVARMESNLLGSRVKNGMHARRKNGKVYTRIVPFGFRKRGDHLTPNVAEQKVIDTMRRMKAHGSSLRKIAAHLDKAGILPREAKAWSAQGVRRILLRVKRDR